LGSSGRLTYHEAFVAQAAREMTATGNWLVPTIGNRPWLEKPPLAFWLVALAGHLSGGIDETVARLPCMLAGFCLVVGLTTFATRRFGPTIGLLAGLIQTTTVWTVMRARLAEVDIILACLVTWAIVAFDRMRSNQDAKERAVERSQQEQQTGDLTSLSNEEPNAQRASFWRWLFFALLGLSALAKGIGFGAVLIISVAAGTAIWDRDRRLLRRLFFFGPGWALAAILGLTWPVLIVLRHPSALGLWVLHITDRLASEPTHFIGTPLWQFGVVVLGQLLPWTPLAVVGAYRSIGRTLTVRGGGDRLLWAWFVIPLMILSLATVKNPHYAIHALPPCSIWAALGLTRLAQRLQWRGWSPERLRQATWVGFAGFGLTCALGYVILGPRLDRRGVEWAFYEKVSRTLHADEPLVLLYNVPDWDREPYPSPFGAVPHDLAVRLYYLHRPASWHFGADELSNEPALGSKPFAVVGRECDIPALGRLGKLETLALGPSLRKDRTYRLFRVVPEAAPDSQSTDPRLTQIGGKWNK
jgi:4-amino-4-deoxy-L-arabinose transferase-like glycosyltransferase